jgi:hypothetical protein
VGGLNDDGTGLAELDQIDHDLSADQMGGLEDFSS